MLDNGRGGVDPATGPNAIRPAALAEVPRDVGSVDTDSGVAAIPDAAVDGAAGASVEALVDQDVPGAATGGPDGADPVARDADG